MSSYIALTNIEIIRMRNNFNRDMEEHFKLKPNKPPWTPERVAEVLAKIDMYNARDPATRESNQYYYYFSKYDIITKNGKRILMPKNQENELGEIVPTDEYFDIILRLHLFTGHGGRQKMYHRVKGELFIPSIIMGFLPRHCQICTFKKAMQRGWGPTMLTDHKRGYVTIIDMTMTPDVSEPHKKYKYILHYMDLTTKHSILRPLTTNSEEKVAKELQKMFLEVGGPALLDSNDFEYTKRLTSALTTLDPNYTVLHWVAEVSVKEEKKYKNDVKDNILRWMEENKSTKWSMGIYDLASSMNATYVEEIGMTPFEAMYGYKYSPGINLISMGVPEAVAKNLKTEKDLMECLGNIFPESLQKTPKVRTSPKVYDSIYSEHPWCWVCEHEDEEVAFLCRKCCGAIHEDCGKYNALKEIICNLCMESRIAPETVEVKKEPPKEDIETLHLHVDTKKEEE